MDQACLRAGQAGPSQTSNLANIADVENDTQTEPLRQLPGTRLAWRGLRGWLDAVYAVNRSMRCSGASYARAARLYRALTLEDIRRSRSLPDISELLELLREARYSDAPLRYGLGRVHSRAKLGEMIVETTNHARWIEQGCPRRTPGPRLDPAHLPDDRLDHLIQTHADLDLVERLRKERRRRQEKFAQGTNIQCR